MKSTEKQLYELKMTIDQVIKIMENQPNKNLLYKREYVEDYMSNYAVVECIRKLKGDNYE